MFPPLLVMDEPVFITIAPVPLPSKSLLNTTFSLLLPVRAMLTPAFITMSRSACKVRVASALPVTAMLLATVMSPLPVPLALVVLTTTLVPPLSVLAKVVALMVLAVVPLVLGF